MSANLPLPTLAIKDWLQKASALLTRAAITTATLDAEILLAHTLRKSRTYLHAHADDELSPRDIEIADARLDLRLDHVPVAYIIGHKEFYGHPFRVTPSVLIPRPESESFITSLHKLLPSVAARDGGENLRRLVDVGTGSGCLGITAKLEFPALDVTLIDNSKYALRVALDNAKRLHATVTELQSNLLAQYPLVADIILANLPYVDPEWERSPETDHEPSVALFADNHGLALIEKLLPEAAYTLSAHGLLLLEADPSQHDAITNDAKRYGFVPLHQEGYVISFQKD